MEKNKTNSEYKFILAQTNDIPEIKAIGNSFWGKEGVYSDKYYLDILKQNLSYVYKENNIVIAFCLVKYVPNIHFISIDLLCVKTGYQGKGLGKSLLTFCINNCVQKKYYRFYLHVAKTNTVAYNLYKKLGFYIDRFIPNYYYNDKPPHNDAYLMVLFKSNIKPKDTQNSIKSEKEEKSIEKEENQKNKYNYEININKYNQEYNNKNNNFFYDSNQGKFYNQNYNHGYNYSGYTTDYWQRYRNHNNQLHY